MHTPLVGNTTPDGAIEKIGVNMDRDIAIGIAGAILLAINVVILLKRLVDRFRP
jgi:hypothetical protein